MNSESKMSDAAREARRKYYRDWYARNRERVQRQRAARWERKAAANQVKDGAVVG